MIWYRGDNGNGGSGAGTWYAADREYAEFYGRVVELDDADLRVLDLTSLGVGGEIDDEGEVESETYQRVERVTKRFGRRFARHYDAVRLIQWHVDYDGEGQDSLLVLPR
jgi:hypothetical protein